MTSQVAEIIRGPTPVPGSASADGAAFIEWSLTKDASMRPSVHQLYAHPWIKAHTAAAPLRNAALRALGFLRADSFSGFRNVTMGDSDSEVAGMHADSALSSPGGGSCTEGGAAGGGAAARDVPNGGAALAMHALQHGRMLGHSNSANAVQMLRFRDIALMADPQQVRNAVLWHAASCVCAHAKTVCRWWTYTGMGVTCSS